MANSIMFINGHKWPTFMRKRKKKKKEKPKVLLWIYSFSLFVLMLFLDLREEILICILYAFMLEEVLVNGGQSFLYTVCSIFAVL